MRCGLRRAALLLATGAVLLAGCTDDGGAPRYPDAADLSLTQVLELVPASVVSVSYTHWTTLHHRTSGYAAHTATSSWVRNAADFAKVTGVGAADPNWTLTATPSDLDAGESDLEVQTITQWSDGGKLGRFVEALSSHGWRRAASDGQISLTRSAPLNDSEWQWAHADDFVVRPDRGLVVQYPHATKPLLAATRSILDARGARAAVAPVDAPVTGQLRVGSAACPQYRTRDRMLSAEIVTQYAHAVGSLRPISAVNTAVTGPDGLAGTLAVSLPSPLQASTELQPRERAKARLPLGDSTISIDGARTSGTTDVFALKMTEPIDLYQATTTAVFGADACGLN